MSKKLTLNKMKDIKSTKDPITVLTFPLENNEFVDIEFDTNISLYEESQIIDSIASGVFSNDEYMPQLRDLMTFVAMIKYMSNIPVPKVKGTDNADITMCSEWMKTIEIIDVLNGRKTYTVEIFHLQKWFNRINSMITDKLEFKKQEILSAQRVALQNAQNEIESYVTMLMQFVEVAQSADIGEMTDVMKKIANKDEKELANNIIDIQSARESEEDKE